MSVGGFGTTDLMMVNWTIAKYRLTAETRATSLPSSALGSW